MDRSVLTIGIVAGEESGDLLGADLVRALAERTGCEVRLVGVGGRHLMELGLKPLFDSADIALMGVTAIVRDLPRLWRRIGETADAIADAGPDCLVTIDSPEFALRIAKRVRARRPGIPAVHYVCPSVWAWRPGRAPAMKPFVDRILCLLPFEPAELSRLGGPEGVYVGHRLASDPGVLAAAAAQARPKAGEQDRARTLLLLPGSRRGEVDRLIDVFGETADVLIRRGNRLRLVMPTLPRLVPMIEKRIGGWKLAPEIVTEPAAKWTAFGEADAALIASGTVSLELALSGVPMVSTYRLDPLAKLASRLVTTWSALLPNLIADRAIVPEFYNRFVIPVQLARYLEALLSDSQFRAWQVAGFAEVRRRMATERPAGALAADAVLDLVDQRRAIGT